MFKGPYLLQAADEGKLIVHNVQISSKIFPRTIGQWRTFYITCIDINYFHNWSVETPQESLCIIYVYLAYNSASDCNVLRCISLPCYVLLLQALKVLRTAEYTPFIVFIAAPTMSSFNEVNVSASRQCWPPDVTSCSHVSSPCL